MILLIWQNIPDNTKFFRVHESSDIGAMALSSSGKYINGDDLPEDHPIFTLSEMISENKLDEIENPHGTINELFNKIVICGFFL